MKVGNTNYEKVAEIDGSVIFADKDGYFFWEHYVADNSYFAILVRLGQTAKEVEQALADNHDWNYRAWHGEMDAILKAQEEVRKLPDIHRV